MEHQSFFPLLALPGEIREIVWTYALGNRQLKMKDPRAITKGGTRRRPQPNEIKFSPFDDKTPLIEDVASSLLFVNRQIWAETEPIFYGTNLFVFMAGADVRDWLASRTDRQRSRVRAIGFIVFWNNPNFFTPKPLYRFPPSIESVHLFGAANGYEKSELDTINDLDHMRPTQDMMAIDPMMHAIVVSLYRLIKLIVKRGPKVKDISLHLRHNDSELEKWELVRRAVVYCRDVALGSLPSDLTNYSGKPYQCTDCGLCY